MTVISNSKHLIQQAMRLKCCLRILLGAGLLILVIYLILVNELLCNDKNGPQQSRHNNISNCIQIIILNKLFIITLLLFLSSTKNFRRTLPNTKIKSI